MSLAITHIGLIAVHKKNVCAEISPAVFSAAESAGLVECMENLKSYKVDTVSDWGCNELSVSPVKRLILETMWVLDKPARATEIAKDTGVNFPSVMMHIIGLTRLGYAMSSEKGLYAITEKGKKSLGLPEVGKEKATEILAYLPVEKSFHFYADYGKPLSVHAASLQDFCEKIMNVDSSSIEFHTSRGDFEAWFNTLGDSELARKALLIREHKLVGEELRKKLHDAVKNRYEELAKVKKQADTNA